MSDGLDSRLRLFKFFIWFLLSIFFKFLFIIFRLFEKKILVIFSKLSIFFILNLIFFLGLKCKTIEVTLGLGKKEFLETKKVFIIFNLKLVIIDNLPYLDDLYLALIFSPNSF